ncbi:MAG: Wzz/FepE/Etk N-terminal domain-containing protein, partial [Aquificota bacterium]|nr:Wzz/FepE/Etk N-terminal domain-containing protein [Aquificota bacterium]
MEEREKREVLEEEEIDLYELFLRIWDHRKLIAGITVLITSLVGVLSFVMT